MTVVWKFACAGAWIAEGLVCNAEGVETVWRCMAETNDACGVIVSMCPLVSRRTGCNN